jgi:hypothetical protein
MLETLRQLLFYPKEFRIAPPKWPDFSEAMEDMVSLLESPLSETEISSGKGKGLLNLTVEMGTAVWRLQRRLTTEGEVPEEIKRVSRDLESIGDALRQAGIEIKDHTGEKYVSGMALRVIAFQPTPDLSQEQVIETIKPTIYRKDKIIQMGEVIVGVPEVAAKPDTPE